jgi:hypothetical protein
VVIFRVEEEETVVSVAHLPDLGDAEGTEEGGTTEADEGPDPVEPLNPDSVPEA